MKRLKKVLALTLALTMLTACGQQAVETGATPEPTEATPQPTATPEPTATPVPTEEPAKEPTREKGVVQVFEESSVSNKIKTALWEKREFTTRQMEQLDRGLVAAKTGDGVFVSWRWLGNESNTVKYNLYRDGQRVNPFELNVTNYTDTNGTAESTYQVAAVVDGVEQEKCEAVSVWEGNYIEIPLNVPAEYVKRGNMKQENGVYSPNEANVGDLDGDGEYEIVLKWSPNDAKDNSQEGVTSPTILDAYEMDGTFMWRIDLGPNIRSGAHYTQFMVYDLDGDGKAEIVCKTSDATVDGAGNVIGDPEGYYVRSMTGRIDRGPEYLTVFDGETGAAIDTIDYEVGRGNVLDWGDSNGNRCDRFLACVAYLDGVTPSVVMCRGYYTRAYLVAYNFVDGKLQKVWHFDSDEAGNEAVAGQGNHSVTVADIDMDGKDEIIYGAAAIDDNGRFMYSTGLGHGDAQHTGDLIPSRPGLETFSVHEGGGADYGLEMRDSMTGEIIWGSYEGTDVGRGVSADVDPNYPGCESWAAGKLIASTGEVISTDPGISSNFRIYWDGDLGEEVQDSNHIDKWNSEKNATELLMSQKGYTSANGTKATPGITCDLIGDWREETILFKNDGSAMTIFTTTIPTDYKIYTLMHDLQYRTYVTTQNVAYNQPPHTGYYLGYDTTEIPVPRVSWEDGETTVINPDLASGTKYYAVDSLMREESVALQVGSAYALVNDSVVKVDANGVAPFENKGVVYVPLDFIAESLGVGAEYKNNICTIDGKTVTLEAKAETKDGTVCVPVSVVKELGKVVMTGENGVVVIRDAEAVQSDDGTTQENMTTLDAATVQAIIDILSNYAEPIIEESVIAVMAVTEDMITNKKISVQSVVASNDDGNIAEWAVDGDLKTRWNGWDDGATLTMDLGSSQQISAVAAAFYKSNERNYYFDIEVSVDGTNWTPVLTAVESPVVDEREFTGFKFPETVEARYVRYVGHNSSSNNANNIWEFVVLAP